ncbi:MAG TPA: BON domain-containing protein [Thermoanaerobaculia bacterium]|nr:BON domain-containing protein [Thermoanaerobaculia bacterium]
MDDSERSYGYSEDIYHGRRGPGGQYGSSLHGDGDGPFYPDQEHWERSYEYGPEWSLGQPHPGDYGPEEEAVHTRGDRVRERRPRPASPSRRGFGMGSSFHGGESWTWDVEGPHRGRGPEGYRRSDERVHEEVCERLAANGRLDAGRMRVRVDDGEVTLEGEVPDRRSKRLAEVIADTVAGVVDVHNRLTLAGGVRRDGDRRQAPGRRDGGHGPSGEPTGERKMGDRPIAEGRDPETGRLLEPGEVVGVGAGRGRESRD